MPGKTGLAPKEKVSKEKEKESIAVKPQGCRTDRPTKSPTSAPIFSAKPRMLAIGVAMPTNLEPNFRKRAKATRKQQAATTR